MFLRRAMTCMLFLVPAMAWADPVEPAAKKPAAPAPEALLAPNSLLYLRFDGFEPHRQAADKTAFADIMRGDLGHFVEHVCGLIKQSTLPDLVAEMPDECRVLGTKAAPKLLDYFDRHGVVVGVEVLDTKPLPRGQLTLVFPQAGTETHRAMFFELFEALAKWADCTVKEGDEQGRHVYQTTVAFLVRVAWWQEGEHLVFTAGTESVDHTLARLHEPREGEPQALNLAHNPLFQAVNSFRGYETVSRGFIDCHRLLELAKDWMDDDTSKIVEELGLDGLQSITWHFGYEGKATRSTVAVRTTGERKGLLALTSDLTSVDVKNLPPIPPDATDVQVRQVDWRKVGAVVGKLAEIVDPDNWQGCQETVAELTKSLGKDPIQELFGCLGSTVVTYNSPSEGWQFLGLGIAIEVKDPANLQAMMEKLIDAFAKEADDDIQLKKHCYHGVDLYTLHVVSDNGGLAVVPTYTIHKGWLVAGLFPQRVQGYILRATEDYPAWKPSPQLTAALAANPKAILFGNGPGAQSGVSTVVSVAENNPEPTIKFLLSLAPILGGYLNMTVPDSFDPVMVPNAHEVARGLFPNVTLLIDDGDAIRWESYTSLALPFDLGSLTSWYGVACLAATVSNGGFDPTDMIPHIGQTSLPDPQVAPATYQPPIAPEPAAPPPAAGKEPGKGRVDPAGAPGMPPPFTPLPAPPAPAGGLSFPNLLKMAANPPLPNMPQPLPPGAGMALPAIPNGPINVLPPQSPLPPGSNGYNPLVPAVPPVPAMPGVPAMPAMPNGLPQAPGFRLPPAIVPGPQPASLKIKAYPVADLLAKDAQGAPETVVIRLVKMVEPNTWEEHGGFGAIDYFPLSNSLIIRQSPEVHEKVEKFLKELEETVAKQKGK